MEVDFFFNGFSTISSGKYFLHYPFNKHTVVLWILTEVAPNREGFFFKVAG